ncbi:MAG: hypothetical protein U0174_16305 [Polyangiaceae bacterium]
MTARLALHAWALLFVFGVITILPIVSARQLPFADLPEHAAVSAALAHWNDPAWKSREFFSFDPTTTPYWLYDLVGALLARVVGSARVAHVLLLSLVGVAIPLAAAHWLRSLGRDPRLGVFACVLFWSKALHYGLLPFVAAIPVFFLAIAEYTYMLRSRRSRVRRAFVTALLGLTLVLLHATVFFAFVLTSLCSGLSYRARRGPPLALRFAPLVSGCLLVAFYWARAKEHMTEATVGFLPLGRMLASIPEWSFGVWHRRDEKVMAMLYWGGYLGVFLTGFRRLRSGLLPWWPFIGVATIFFTFPFEIGTGLMLNIRMGPLLAVLLLPTLRLRATRSSIVAQLLVLVGVVGQSVVALAGIENAQASLGDFDRIIESVPMGSRVIHLPFESGTPSPWRHIAAAIRVERGGLSQYSFTHLAHWPLQDRVSPRKPYLFWDRRPCVFDPDSDAQHYDAILVTGPYDPFRGVEERERHAAAASFELTVSAPPFYLWQRKGTGIAERRASPPDVDLRDAPCPKWGTP